VVSACALALLDRLCWPRRCSGLRRSVVQKGEAAQEVETARSMWDFNVELIPSRTEPEGHIVLVRQPKPKPKNEGK
jgi:hypothetical protein